jgi:hypothetical protein
VEIILQHRNTPFDEMKRRHSWVEQLQRYASDYCKQDANYDTRPENIAKIKNRILDVVLPSLFTVLTSYEQYTAQERLWNYNDDEHFPKGPVIEWQSIPCPHWSEAKITADGSSNVPTALDCNVEKKWDIARHFQPMHHDASEFRDYRYHETLRAGDEVHLPSTVFNYWE